MAPKIWLRLLLIVALGLSMGYEVAAKEPIFVRWLLADDPGDATILVYWERYGQGALSPSEKIDLGTMLYYRGYPKDAVRVFNSALDDDKELYEAWFRIGLVEHQQGNHRKARVAYQKSLDILKGQGWCNFYLGLLEEQEGHAKTAMGYYSAAFRVAPELANPEINPEVVSSDLSLGAWLKLTHERAFKNDLPMPFLEPNEVKKTMSVATDLVEAGDLSDDEGEIDDTGASVEAAPEVDGQATGRAAPDAGAPPGSGSVPLAPATTSGADAGSKQQGKAETKPAARGRAPKPRKTAPTPTPTPKEDIPYGEPESSDDLPYGLPSTRGVSPEAYPGF